MKRINTLTNQGVGLFFLESLLSFANEPMFHKRARRALKKCLQIQQPTTTPSLSKLHFPSKLTEHPSPCFLKKSFLKGEIHQISYKSQLFHKNIIFCSQKKEKNVIFQKISRRKKINMSTCIYRTILPEIDPISRPLEALIYTHLLPREAFSPIFVGHHLRNTFTVQKAFQKN